jgi:hypothetical protein
VRPVHEFSTCCCPDDIAAVAQCAVDQLVGMVTLSKQMGLTFSPDDMLKVAERTAGYVQDHLDDYAKHHGAPDVHHQIAATEAILKAMAD